MPSCIRMSGIPHRPIHLSKIVKRQAPKPAVGVKAARATTTNRKQQVSRAIRFEHRYTALLLPSDGRVLSFAEEAGHPEAEDASSCRDHRSARSGGRCCWGRLGRGLQRCSDIHSTDAALSCDGYELGSPHHLQMGGQDRLGQGYDRDRGLQGGGHGQALEGGTRPIIGGRHQW